MKTYYAAAKNIIVFSNEFSDRYRPFAPAVLTETANDFFKIPQHAFFFGYIGFAVKVKEDKRQLL